MKRTRRRGFVLLAVLFIAGLSVRRLAALDGKPWYATATAALP